MSATTTEAPSSANASAEQRPIPEPPPVITATRPFSLSIESSKHFVSVALDLDVRKHGCDCAILVHDEGGAGDTHVFATHEFLQLPDAVLVGHGVVGIGQ